MIKTVIFDIDGTMYDYEKCNRLAMEALKEYCVLHLDITTTTFHRTLRKADEILVSRIGYSCASVHNRLLRYQCMLELLEKPLFPHALAMHHRYWNTLFEHMMPFPGLKEYMEILKQRKISIGIGTNMTACIQYEKLKKLGVSSLVSWIVSSEEVGVEKPDSKFFQCCLEKSRCAAEECLFIGDSLEGDVLGAAGCGMNAWLYEPVDQTDQATRKGIKKVKSYEVCIEEMR